MLCCFLDICSVLVLAEKLQLAHGNFNSKATLEPHPSACTGNANKQCVSEAVASGPLFLRDVNKRLLAGKSAWKTKLGEVGARLWGDPYQAWGDQSALSQPTQDDPTGAVSTKRNLEGIDPSTLPASIWPKKPSNTVTCDSQDLDCSWIHKSGITPARTQDFMGQSFESLSVAMDQCSLNAKCAGIAMLTPSRQRYELFTKDDQLTGHWQGGLQYSDREGAVVWEKDCVVVVRGQSGYIADKMGYYAYDHNIGCRWSIRPNVPVHEHVVIAATFVYLDLEQGSGGQCHGCTCDHVKIYDGQMTTQGVADITGPAAEGNYLGRVCGTSNSPFMVVSTGPGLFLQFFSDDLVMLSGFVVQWEVLALPKYTMGFQENVIKVSALDSFVDLTLFCHDCQPNGEVVVSAKAASLPGCGWLVGTCKPVSTPANQHQSPSQLAPADSKEACMALCLRSNPRAVACQWKGDCSCAVYAGDIWTFENGYAGDGGDAPSAAPTSAAAQLPIQAFCVILDQCDGWFFQSPGETECPDLTRTALSESECDKVATSLNRKLGKVPTKPIHTDSVSPGTGPAGAGLPSGLPSGLPKGCSVDTKASNNIYYNTGVGDHSGGSDPYKYLLVCFRPKASSTFALHEGVVRVDDFNHSEYVIRVNLTTYSTEYHIDARDRHSRFFAISLTNYSFADAPSPEYVPLARCNNQPSKNSSRTSKGMDSCSSACNELQDCIGFEFTPKTAECTLLFGQCSSPSFANCTNDFCFYRKVADYGFWKETQRSHFFFPGTTRGQYAGPLLVGPTLESTVSAFVVIEAINSGCHLGFQVNLTKAQIVCAGEGVTAEEYTNRTGLAPFATAKQTECVDMYESAARTLHFDECEWELGHCELLQDNQSVARSIGTYQTKQECLAACRMVDAVAVLACQWGNGSQCLAYTTPVRQGDGDTHGSYCAVLDKCHGYGDPVIDLMRLKALLVAATYTANGTSPTVISQSNALTQYCQQQQKDNMCAVWNQCVQRQVCSASVITQSVCMCPLDYTGVDCSTMREMKCDVDFGLHDCPLLSYAQQGQQQPTGPAKLRRTQQPTHNNAEQYGYNPDLDGDRPCFSANANDFQLRAHVECKFKDVTKWMGMDEDNLHRLQRQGYVLQRNLSEFIFDYAVTREVKGVKELALSVVPNMKLSMHPINMYRLSDVTFRNTKEMTPSMINGTEQVEWTLPLSEVIKQRNKQGYQEYQAGGRLMVEVQVTLNAKVTAGRSLFLDVDGYGWRDDQLEGGLSTGVVVVLVLLALLALTVAGMCFIRWKRRSMQQTIQRQLLVARADTESEHE